jgi:hypothetical protein
LGTQVFKLLPDIAMAFNDICVVFNDCSSKFDIKRCGLEVPGSEGGRIERGRTEWITILRNSQVTSAAEEEDWKTCMQGLTKLKNGWVTDKLADVEDYEQII